MTHTNGTADVLTTNGTARLTPAEARCLTVYRGVATAASRAPFIDELAERQNGIRKESAMRLVEKLRAKGYDLPLSLRARFDRAACAHVGAARRPRATADLEMELVRDLLREADAIFSAIAVMDRPRRDDWRRRAKMYLDGADGAGRVVPPGGEG